MSVATGDESLLDAVVQTPGSLRVAVSTKPVLVAPVNGEVKQAVQQTADRLRSLGHTVEHEDPPYPLLSPALSRYLGGIAQDANERIERPERLQRRTKGFARMGSAIPRPVLEWARREDDTGRYRPSSSATMCS